MGSSVRIAAAFACHLATASASFRPRSFINYFAPSSTRKLFHRLLHRSLLCSIRLCDMHFRHAFHNTGAPLFSFPVEDENIHPPRLLIYLPKPYYVFRQPSFLHAGHKTFKENPPLPRRGLSRCFRSPFVRGSPCRKGHDPQGFVRASRCSGGVARGELGVVVCS